MITSAEVDDCTQHAGTYIRTGVLPRYGTGCRYALTQHVLSDRVRRLFTVLLRAALTQQRVCGGDVNPFGSVMVCVGN